MIIKRSFSIAKRVFRGMFHEPRTIVLMLIAPIMAMMVFGIAFSGDVHHVKVAVVNLDEGLELPFMDKICVADKIMSNIDPEVLDVQYVDSEDAGVELVEAGEAYAVIVFPENLTTDLMAWKMNPAAATSAAIKIRLDKAIYNVAITILQTFTEAMMTTVEENGESLPLSLDSGDAIYGENAQFMDFFVPGVMGFASFLITALLTIVAFVQERKNATLERLLTTPASEGEIVAGYAIFFGLVGIIQALLLIGTAVVVFQVNIEGNLLLAFAAMALLSLVSLSLGILLSSLARTEVQAVQFIPLIVLPAFLLAGIFWPVEAIPQWLRPLSYLIPPYYAIEACRSIMIRGWGFAKVWTDFAALFAFCLVFLGLAGLSLKKVRA